jgi:SHS2 domain-containing protein
MAYGWGDHVGELELRVQAATEQEVFADAVRAFGELVSGEEEVVVAAAEPRAIAVAGADRAALLAGLLNELVVLAETEGFVPDAMVSVALGDGALEARVRGGRGTPPHLVKAVTHHRLVFEPAPGGWRANAVLDV